MPLPMINFTVAAGPNAAGVHPITLTVAHIDFVACYARELRPEVVRDLTNLKHAVAAAAKVAKILAATKPQCAGDEWVTIEIKRTDLAEIEKLLKVTR